MADGQFVHKKERMLGQRKYLAAQRNLCFLFWIDLKK
jgi:hypothetical protein